MTTYISRLKNQNRLIILECIKNGRNLLEKKLKKIERFNDKFQKNLLENGDKNFMQGIYLGYIYCRYIKIRNSDKDDPKENKGQIQLSFKKF